MTEQKRNDSLSDGSLMCRVKDQDDDAARELFNRYVGQLRRLAEKGIARDLNRLCDPDDITQSVFRTFFRRVANGQYNLPQGETIGKLLSVIALNKIRFQGRVHRAAKRDIGRSCSLHNIGELPGGNVDDEESLRILQLTIGQLLINFTTTQQRIIQYRLEELDIAAIASNVGCSKRTVERVLQRFRSDLQRIIGDDDT